MIVLCIIREIKLFRLWYSTVALLYARGKGASADTKFCAFSKDLYSKIYTGGPAEPCSNLVCLQMPPPVLKSRMLQRSPDRMSSLINPHSPLL